MDQHASVFKDDILRGISLAIKNLQHQDAEVKSLKPKASHVINKQNAHFRNLLNYLDLTFSFGLKDSKKGYWPLVKKVAHSSVLDIIEKHPCVNSEIKKGYVWLYLTFVENSLDSYLRMVLLEVKAVRSYYKNFAILRDEERCEILLNLIAGVESLTFTIDIDDPYLDYGHDPILREEKIVVRAQPPQSNVKKADIIKKQQPDITIFSEGRKPQQGRDYPDLVKEHSKHFNPSTPPNREGVEVGGHLVQHISKKVKKKKQRTQSIPKEAERDQPDGPIKENIKPQVVGTPDRETNLPEGNASQATSPGVLKTSDPMMKSFSAGDYEYREFLATYDETNDFKSDVEDIEKAVFDDNDGSDRDAVMANEKFKKLNVKGVSDCQFRYISNTGDMESDRERATSSDNSPLHQFEEFYDEYEIYRTDSFDRFCRRGSPDIEQKEGERLDQESDDNKSRVSLEQGLLAEHDFGSTPITVPPQISKESLLRHHSPITKSLSKTSIDKLNDARYDTKTGILLPTLPRRPTIDDAAGLIEDIEIDQNLMVLISLDIFQQPTESLIKVFKVAVGHLAGYGAPFHFLISNFAVYLLKQRASVQAGFINMLSVNFDSINKVQTGLNFQDVYIFHDQGCLHFTTGDEITTRSIISTIKATIKSSQGAPTTDSKEPMASNTYNELELVIQDWLICHTHVEEPEILHFSLIYYSSLSSSEKQKRKVIKAGEMSYRHSNFGLITYWEKAFFALRGHYLYQYNAKRIDLKHKYDLSTQCGGCVHSGREDNGTHILKIIGNDGSTTILELGIYGDEEADEWLMTMCQAVADAKIREGSFVEEPDALIACGLVLTQSKIFLFNQEPSSGRLVLEDSCPVYDVTQVCVDNQNRTFCALSINHNLDEEEGSKTMWLFDFNSEYEVGKFEQRLFGCWQLLYQVPLQFVLLNEPSLKKTINYVLNEKGKNHGDLGKETLYQLISN